MKLLIVVIGLIALAGAAEAKIGDNLPFCLFYPPWFKFWEPSLPTTNVDVNLSKYAGLWYEAAKKPNPFERDCKCSSAFYTLQDDGKVGVRNECVKANDAITDIVGIARKARDNDSTKLLVNFNSFFSGNYWILDLDRDYKVVVVGEPCKRYLWVLSREPELDPKIVQKKLDYAKSIGYNIDNVEIRDYEFCRGKQ
eukprot:Nk52_evm3s621 gene=Nk52_evmTU3s621